MKLRLATPAYEELRLATDAYEAISASLRDRFLDEVERAFNQIVRHPDRFPRYEGAPELSACRRVVLQGFPYYLPYEVHPTIVRVLAVAHASRRPGFWEGR